MNQRYFFVNYKLELVASLENAIEMTENLQNAPVENVDVTTVIVPGVLDLAAVQDTFAHAFNVFAPHVDPISPGKGTGFVPPALVWALGCEGTVLNHAEHKLKPDVLEKTVEMARALGLKIMICADSLEETTRVLQLKPDFIAYEPPELIGGDISVSTAKSEIVGQFAQMVQGSAIPIIGAGIKTKDDVVLSVELGAQGIFVASGVVKAGDPIVAFIELMSGFSPRKA